MSTATILWTDPTLRTDVPPTPIAPDTFHINIFDDASPTPATPIGSVASGVQTFTTDPLSVGVHNFSAVVVDSEGDVSVSVPFGSVTVPLVLAAPQPPVFVSVTLNP